MSQTWNFTAIKYIWIMVMFLINILENNSDWLNRLKLYWIKQLSGAIMQVEGYTFTFAKEVI